MNKKQTDILKVLYENREKFRDPKGWDMHKILKNVEGYYEDKRLMRCLFQELVDNKMIIESKEKGYSVGEYYSLYRISPKGVEFLISINAIIKK